MEAGDVRPEFDLEVARLVCDKRVALGREGAEGSGGGADYHFCLLFSSLITFFLGRGGGGCWRVARESSPV